MPIVRAAVVSAAVALGVATVAVAASSDSIRLIRAHPAIVLAACRQAQAHSRLKVTCPSLIPATRYVTREGLWGQMDFSPSLWAITFNNGDNGVGYVHWIAGAGTVAAVRVNLFSDALNVVKGLPQVIKRSRVKGYAVTTYEYPFYPAGGPNGSHTAAFVVCGNLRVFASIHGHGHEAAVTAMAVDLAHRAHCK